MPHPINYDFGANWKKKIVPHLDTLDLRMSIREGIRDYLDQFPKSFDRYCPQTVPASYSSRDLYARLMDKKRRLLLKELRDAEELPKEFLDMEEFVQELLDDGEENHEMFWYLEDMKGELLAPYFYWPKLRYNLESYFVSGACHSWNSTFGVTLARLVCPKEKWSILRGHLHTTVINEDHTKVFDILYWGAFENRLERHVFGDDFTSLDSDDESDDEKPKKFNLDKRDPTLGGKEAYLDAMTKPPKCEKAKTKAKKSK